MRRSSIGNRRVHRPAGLSAALALVAFGALVALWAYRTGTTLAVEGDPSLWAMRDFRDGIYYPVVAWLDGVNPYSPAQFLGTYPATQMFPLVSPGVLLLNAPFALLPYEQSLVAYFAFSVLLLLAYSPILLTGAGVAITPTRALWLAVFLVAGRPAYAALTLGQGVLPVAIGVTLALHFARTRPFLGGLGLSLALLKPTFGVPLVVLMLARREYRAIRNGILLAVGMAAIPLAVILANTGIHGFVAGIMETLSEWGGHPSVRLLGSDVGRFDASAALVRLFRLSLADASSLPVALVVIGAAYYASRRLHRPPAPSAPADRAESDRRTLSSLIMLLAVLLGVYHQRYDAIVLAGPIVALATRHPGMLSGRTRLLVLALLLGVWFNYLSTQMAVHVLDLTPWEWPWRIVASANAVALSVVFVVACVAALRAPRPGPSPDGIRSSE